MRHKLIFMLAALVMLAGAFSMPAFADTVTETMTVNRAWVEGDTLKLNLTGKQTGTSSTMELNLKDYDLSREYITVQAVDANGNKSNAVKIQNPFYTPPADEQTQTVSVIPQGAFTPNGSGTVLDNATSDDGKEFYTVKTPDDNVFYLVIDRMRNADNVYFLNAVTEDDLMSLAQKKDGNKGGTSTSGIPSKPTDPQEVQPSPTPEVPANPPAKNGDNSSMILLIIAVIAVGGAGYYFKIYRPKQQAPADEPEDDFDEDWDNDDNEDNEDENNEFENEGVLDE